MEFQAPDSYNSLKIKFVANYLRKSRGEDEEVLSKHRLVLETLCKKNNWKYVEYSEVGTSDSIELRPQMIQLLNEIENNSFDAVCVVEYDRLGRGDLGEQDRIKKAFQNSDTLIITPEKIYNLNDDLDDTFADFRGLFARQELKMITKRFRQGKRIGALRGDWTNGIPPFPYVYQRYKDKFHEKGLVIHDDRYIIYREMVERALRRESPTEISHILNDRGLRTPRGSKWYGVGIERILLDETGLGKIISNKSEGDGHRNKKPNAKPARKIPREEWTVVENCHEAVKTQEEHDKLVDFIAGRKRLAPRARMKSYGFTGLVKCERCGGNHTFATQRGVEVMKSCRHRDDAGNKCQNGGIKVEIIEKLVIKEIKKYEQQILVGAETNPPTLARLQNEMKSLEPQLAKLKKAIEKIDDAYEMGDYTRDEWIERKQRRKAEIQKLSDRMREVKKGIDNSQQYTNEERKVAIEDFFEKILQAENNKEKHELYSTIIESIIWYKDADNIRIKINFK